MIFARISGCCSTMENAPYAMMHNAELVMCSKNSGICIEVRLLHSYSSYARRKERCTWFMHGDNNSERWDMYTDHKAAQWFMNGDNNFAQWDMHTDQNSAQWDMHTAP